MEGELIFFALYGVPVLLGIPPAAKHNGAELSTKRRTVVVVMTVGCPLCIRISEIKKFYFEVHSTQSQQSSLLFTTSLLLGAMGAR